MPSGRGHGHHHSRWYKLCFSDNSADSDDSDSDPIFQVHSSAPSVAIEESPDSGPESDWDCSLSSPPLPAYPLPLPPPPPPPPPVLSPSPSPPPSPPPSYPLPLPPRRARVARVHYTPPPPPPPPPPLLPPPSFNIVSLWAMYEAHGSSSSHAPRSLIDQLWPVTETGRIPQVPNEVVRTIWLVDVLSVQLRNELSHCPICMEDFEIGDTVCMLPCNHAYRLVCILRWLETSPTCPVCRLELVGASHIERVPSSSHDIWQDYFPSYFRQPAAETGVISGARDHNSEEAEHYDSAPDEIDDSNGDGNEGGVSG